MRKMNILICLVCSICILAISWSAEAAEQYNWVKVWETYGNKGSVTSTYVADNSIQYADNYNSARAVSQVVFKWSDSTINSMIDWSEFRLPNQSAVIIACINTNKINPNDCTDFRNYGPLNFSTVAIGSNTDRIMDYIWAKIGYKRKRPPGTG